MPSVQVLVLSSLFVSFRPSSLRSHSCSTSASLSGFPLPIRILSSASLPVLTTQPSVLPFRTSRLRLTVASPARRFHSRFHGFPRSSQPGFPCLAPGSRTRPAVCFLSSYPASLPQLFHRCFPSFPLPLVRFSSGLFRLPSAFFRPLRPASDYSAFRAFLSPLPDLP